MAIIRSLEPCQINRICINGEANGVLDGINLRSTGSGFGSNNKKTLRNL